MARGGKRPGAGRKSTTVRRAMANLDETASAALDALAIAWRCSASEAMARAVVEAHARIERRKARE